MSTTQCSECGFEFHIGAEEIKASYLYQKLESEFKTQKELNRKLAEKLANANALILFKANKASDGAVMNHANKLEDYRKEHTCNTTLPCKACDELTQQSQKGQGDGRS